MGDGEPKWKKLGSWKEGKEEEERSRGPKRKKGKLFR